MATSRAKLPKDLEVLIVEDEALLMMTLEDFVTDLGCKVSGRAARLDQLLRVIDGGHFDLAILDANLTGERVEPAAEQLAARGTALVFATGYGDDAFPPNLSMWPVVAKPYSKRQIEQAMLAALSRRTADN
jgi:CheY-like chemotaxis protein